MPNRSCGNAWRSARSFSPTAGPPSTSAACLAAAFWARRSTRDAEPLLIAGYQGMKQRETTIGSQGKPRLTEALERLVQLYDATNKPDEAARRRKELEARKAAGKPPPN